MENTLKSFGIKTRMFGPTMVEATSILNLRRTGKPARVVIDLETGETVSTNVPIGSEVWRRLARIARCHC